MSNMSYCRFENTASDLADCVDILEEKNIDDLSESEKSYYRRMKELCSEFLELCDNFEG